MSQENVELWRSFIEDLRAVTGQQEWDGWLAGAAELWDAEIEWDASESGLPDIGGVYRGKDAVRGFWRDWFAAWETLEFEYELVDAGDRVVMLLDLRMRGRSSGVEVPFGKHAFVATFRDGLVVHSKLYLSQSEALEAAGPRG